MLRTLEELFQAYLAERKLEHEQYTHYLQRVFLRTVVQEVGALPLEGVTPDVLRLWKGRLSQRYKPSTVHRYLMYLSAVLDFAVECDWLETNPMQRIRKPSPGRGRVRFLTEDERPRLLHACRENSKAFLYPMVMIALSTGGRKNEIRTLRWPAVDFAQGVVRFLKTKTHEPRSVPLVGEARSVLEELAQRRPPASA